MKVHSSMTIIDHIMATVCIVVYQQNATHEI